MTEKEIFELFDLYGTDMGDYYEIQVGRIERLVKEIEFQSSPRELSDKEIKEVIRKHWNKELGNRGMLALCKAVLEKASTKCG